MTTWTLTTTGSRLFSEHTIIGASENTERAREQLFTAAAAMIRHADIDERPRYTLQLDDQLAAIIHTGDDELGRPDHPGTAELLAAIQHPSPNPFDRRHPTSGRALRAWPRVAVGAIALARGIGPPPAAITISRAFWTSPRCLQSRCCRRPV